MPVHKKNICVITSTRADYGLLFWLMKAIERSSKLDLNLLVTGTHLSKKHGNTWKFIEADGFRITEKIKVLSGNNQPDGIGKTAANTIKKLSRYLHRHKPQALVILGDRFEMLAAAQAAVITSVPVIHLHGGEISEGANDDLFRHAITKLGSLHFTSNPEHRRRVIQMGEQPSGAFISGALGIENIRKLKLLSRPALEKQYGIKKNEKIFLATFHPATMDKENPENQFRELLQALGSFDGVKIFLSKANADAGGDKINALIDAFAAKNKNVVASSSFGQLNYLSLMKAAAVVIGNSSSGIIEAPSLQTPVVNIGSRQKGRMNAESTVHCAPKNKSIVQAIKKALAMNDPALFKNPYDHGNASEKIVSILEKTDFSTLLPKKFHDLS